MENNGSYGIIETQNEEGLLNYNTVLRHQINREKGKQGIEQKVEVKIKDTSPHRYTHEEEGS